MKDLEGGAVECLQRIPACLGCFLTERFQDGAREFTCNKCDLILVGRNILEVCKRFTGDRADGFHAHEESFVPGRYRSRDDYANTHLCGDLPGSRFVEFSGWRRCSAEAADLVAVISGDEAGSFETGL